MSGHLTHLVLGPERHGVVRFGLELDDALRAVGHRTTLCRSAHPDSVVGLQVQFTDRLFGTRAGDAAARIAGLAERVHGVGRRVTVTLHDVPQASDGRWYAERARAYAEVCAVADGIVVCSEHERLLLSTLDTAEFGSTTGELVVIPLPVGAPAPRPTGQSNDPSVGIFGFLYPGKGHAEVLAAMTDLPAQVPLIAIGVPSAGHDDLVDELTREARRRGRRFVVTGHVPDATLTEVLQSVGVPVVHHRHVSASGSLNAWLAAGRRPLASRSRYTDEVAQRNPDALVLVDDDPGELRAALTAALTDVESTWLPAGSSHEPSVRTTALRYAETLGRWHR
jgi:glycosyltransferase involved in cell wall biosynthesis